MGAFLGQSLGGGLGTGAGMLGNAAAARSFAMKRQMVAARAAGATGGMGRALAGGAVRGLSAVGKIMPHPIAKLGLHAAAIGGGYLLGEDLATEDPFDKKMRKKGEKAAKEAQEAQDTLNTAESFQNLALVRLLKGEIKDARENYRKALLLFAKQGHLQEANKLREQLQGIVKLGEDEL